MAPSLMCHSWTVHGLCYDADHWAHSQRDSRGGVRPESLHCNTFLCDPYAYWKLRATDLLSIMEKVLFVLVLPPTESSTVSTLWISFLRGRMGSGGLSRIVTPPSCLTLPHETPTRLREIIFVFGLVLEALFPPGMGVTGKKCVLFLKAMASLDGGASFSPSVLDSPSLGYFSQCVPSTL